MTIAAGLIGYGTGGRFFHAPFLAAAGFGLRAIATSRHNEVITDYPTVCVIADPAELLARPDIRLVSISTPTDTHAGLARAALEAGKDVVVDKPFTATPEEADELIALAARQGRLLSVLQNRRWDADFLTLQSLVDSGRLGQLRYLQMRFDRFRPRPKPGWRSEIRPGSGILWDLGAHLVDQALQLVGMPDWVFADRSAQGEGAETDDGFTIIMAKGNTRIVLGTSPFALEPQPRMVVHGTEGTFVKSGLDIQEEQSRSGIKPLDVGFGVESSSHHGRLISADGSETIASFTGQYLDYWLKLYAALESGGPPPVDPRDSANGLRILTAAAESAWTGRRIDFG